MTTYEKAKGLLQERGLGLKKNIYKTKHTSRKERQHYIERDLRQQNSMVATQNGSSTTW
jgi:hypothetical protein